MILRLVRKGQQGVRLNNMPYTPPPQYTPGAGLMQSIDPNYGDPYTIGQGPRKPIEFKPLQSDRATISSTGNIELSTMPVKTPPKDLENTTNTGKAGIDVAGAIGGAATIASGSIEAFSKAPGTDQYGIAHAEDKSKAMWQGGLETAGKYAGAGAAIGSLIPIPGVGTAVGAGVGAIIGGVVGAVGAKKENDQAQLDYKKQFQSAYSADKSNKYAQQYAAMGKDGMKLKIQSKLGTVDSNKLVPSYKKGGTMYNTIVKGKLHKENNNLGNKDKGIPVIDSKGVKIFELEKEELILNIGATTKVEELVQNYNTEQSEDTLKELGKFVYEELKLRTIDNSKTFIK